MRDRTDFPAAALAREVGVRPQTLTLTVLQEVPATLWERAEAHELHPGAIRAKAEEIMRAHLLARRRGGRLRVRPTSARRK